MAKWKCKECWNIRCVCDDGGTIYEPKYCVTDGDKTCNWKKAEAKPKKESCNCGATVQENFANGGEELVIRHKAD